MRGKRHIWLMLVSLAVVCFPSNAQENTSNPRITVMDTINQRPTHVDNRHGEPEMSHEWVDRFYDSLRSKSSKRKFPRFLYHAFVVQQKRDTTYSGLYIDENAMLKPFDGKIIGDITIDRKPISDRNRSWLQKTSNNTHVLTREGTIRRDLLFRTGETFNADEMVKNSQVLRSRSYLYDVTIEPVIDPDDSTIVHINVITRDSWTIGVNLDFYEDRETTLSLYDANFIGTGDRIALKTNFDWDFSRYGGNVVEYRMPNVLGTFYRSDARIGRFFNDRYLQVSFYKDFILPSDYMLGASYAQDQLSRYKMYMSDTMRYAQIRFREANAWGGRSLFLKRINSSIYFTGRYHHQYYFDRPPETSADMHPVFHNSDELLFGLGLYREKFYSATMIHGYGFKEYLGAGYKAEIIGGYRWGEFRNGYYMGTYLSKGGFSPGGYLMGEVSIGSYFDPDKRSWYQSAADVELHWFSNLMLIGRSRVRQFLTLQYTHGWNREEGADELLRFHRLSGPRSFNDYVVGRNRVVLNTETVFFTRFQPFGFRIAAFGFADFGLLGDHANMFKNEFYGTFGLGVRLKNERLVFSTIQLRLGFAVGKHGWARNDMLTLTSEQRLNPYRFIPQRPEPVDYK